MTNDKLTNDLSRKRRTMKTLLTLLTSALLLSVAARHASADAIYRTGGQSAVTGDVTESTKTELTIKPKTKPAETIPANEIERVEWTEDPQGLNLARGDESRGLFDKALEAYKSALAAAPANKALLKTEIEFLIARTTGKKALAQQAGLDEAIQSLEAFRTANSKYFRYFEVTQLLGKLHTAKGDGVSARGTYQALAEAPWNDYKMAAKIGTARVDLKENNVAAAQSAFEEVIATAPTTDADKARRFEAMLGKAVCQVKQQQYAPAVKVLDEVIEKAPAGDTALLAEAYVRKGDSYREQGQSDDALLAYLHLDVIEALSRHKEFHAEALYHLTKLWNDAGRSDRAGDATARLQALYPESNWTKQLSGG